MSKVLYTLIVLLSLLENQLLAQPSDKQLVKKIDKLVAESYSALAPGCAVLVAKKNRIIYERAFGSANLELNVPLKPEMVFRIGSITKQYTAIAILKLMEEGKISLNDSIQRFFPGIPFKGYVITIENLLTHTSGLIDYAIFDIHVPNAIRIDLPASLFLDSIVSRPIEFTPGTKYAYSNSNYYLLGMIIEKITGKTFQAYLDEAILRPAGIFNTHYDVPRKIIPGRVTGYTGTGPKYNIAEYISMNHVFSAGALLSNVSDLYKWNKTLRSGSIVRKETLDKAWSSFKLPDSTLSGYGFGWFDGMLHGMKMIWHGGSIDGFKAIECYFPEQEIFFAILINAEGNGIFSLTEKLAEVFAAPSPSIKEIKLSDSVLQSYAGSYIWTEDTTQTITISKKGNTLYADLSNKSGTNMRLVPQTDRLFSIPVIQRIKTTIEFIIENGVVRELIWFQEKKHIAVKSR